MAKSLSIRRGNELRVTRALLLLLSALQANCSTSTVQLQASFPEPVMTPLPIAMGVHYEDDINNFTKKVKLPVTGTEWTIDFNDGQRRAFDKITQAMFAEVEVLADLSFSNTNTRLSGILHPVLEDFQFTTPRQTQYDFYESWLKYRIDILNPDGEKITSWQVSAYGKSKDRLFDDASTGVRQATHEALRDLIAVFISSFRENPQIIEWVEYIQKKPGVSRDQD